jgi:hypothetical protein
MLTAGLKRPPLIRKKTQTLTAREDPNAKDMKTRFIVLGILSLTGIADTIWSAVKPMKRKVNVPQNSPAKAMISFRTPFGTKDNRSSPPSGWSPLLAVLFRNEDI